MHKGLAIFSALESGSRIPGARIREVNISCDFYRPGIHAEISLYQVEAWLFEEIEKARSERRFFSLLPNGIPLVITRVTLLGVDDNGTMEIQVELYS